MRTLRSQLILSHILPLLIVVPLIGVILIYILETQVVLADLSNDLEQQAAMTAEVAADQRLPPIRGEAIRSPGESPCFQRSRRRRAARATPRCT